MSQAWIQTFKGKLFDILAPTQDMIDIEDIAHATSQMNRFTGHCRFPYPVSQHELLGSYVVPDDCQCGSPREHALRFLLHDGSEGYISDISSPLKNFTNAGAEYRKVEKPIQDLIYTKYGLPLIEPKCIKDVDMMMLYTEASKLMDREPWEDPRGTDVEIRRKSFRQNKLQYLARFNQLCRKDDRYQFTFWERVSLLWYKMRGI